MSSGASFRSDSFSSCSFTSVAPAASSSSMRQITLRGSPSRRAAQALSIGSAAARGEVLAPAQPGVRAVAPLKSQQHPMRGADAGARRARHFELGRRCFARGHGGKRRRGARDIAAHELIRGLGAQRVGQRIQRLGQRIQLAHHRVVGRAQRRLRQVGAAGEQARARVLPALAQHQAIDDVIARRSLPAAAVPGASSLPVASGASSRNGAMKRSRFNARSCRRRSKR